MTVRAGVVVTGTEVLTGRVTDRNGPWLAEQLRGLGADVGRIVVVGDRPDDLEAALRHLMADHDLVVTSGGLGPTADDLTARVVGDVQGRPSELHEETYKVVRAVVEELMRRRGWTADPAAVDAGTRKQATVPVGAHVLPPVGTAPGLVVPPADGRTGPPVVVLPGPPSELRGMWPDAVAAPAVRAVLAGAPALLEDTVRLWGTLEADLAQSLRRVEDRLGGLDVSTCLRGGELEVVTRYAPAAADRLEVLRSTLLTDFPRTVFSTDGSTVDDVVGAALVARGWTVAAAESCTGGLLGGRLTARSGSSAYVLGSVAAYANTAKTALLGVPAALVAEHGAVSPQVADAMADGARAAFGADVGIGVTGVAGPGGGTPERPVGTVHVAVAGPTGRRARTLHLPGDREQVREITVTAALHEVRLLLATGGTAAD
ncbi:competence/damage-inducible protein A [Kineosporia sp. A_224]|uniref:competence/damage-inducible protein A n=1 Tax=Kineosporia sp. A_224 TaxID=1962180 RepID=UPI000B4BA40B|nr:competence/damage-inducible protein A [Kineosporia sp. A_224]